VTVTEITVRKACMLYNLTVALHTSKVCSYAQGLEITKGYTVDTG
jgi:6-phosphogluconate dehydrogenase